MDGRIPFSLGSKCCWLVGGSALASQNGQARDCHRCPEVGVPGADWQGESGSGTREMSGQRRMRATRRQMGSWASTQNPRKITANALIRDNHHWAARVRLCSNPAEEVLRSSSTRWAGDQISRFGLGALGARSLSWVDGCRGEGKQQQQHRASRHSSRFHGMVRCRAGAPPDKEGPVSRRAAASGGGLFLCDRSTHVLDQSHQARRERATGQPQPVPKGKRGPDRRGSLAR